MVKIIECGKFKGKKLFDKLLGSEKASASLMANPSYKRYTVRHSIQNDVVRVTIYDNKVNACAVKATGHYVYNPTRIITNKSITDLANQGSAEDMLYFDVDEPDENERMAGITLEQKIATAYVKLQATADKMNYEETKPYRLAEAVKNFEANKDVLTSKKP